MKTSDLVALLAGDAAPVRPVRGALAAALAAGAALAGLAFVVEVGPRPDIDAAVTSLRFLFKFVVTTALAAGAAGALMRLARPDGRLGGWGWALAAAPLLLAASALVEMAVMPASTWTTRMMGHNARVCLTLVPLMAIGPLACLILALRGAAPSRPGTAGLVAGLAAAGLAATFYAANCTDDSPLFVALWYPCAAALVSAAGWLAGRLLLRW